MTIFKCKMCGGTLEIKNNETVVTCEYCGTQQTLPKLDDDRKVNLYDRANHFRRNNEFDKAMGIYEQILNEDRTDAEAYWSLVLCRYGIEYVEDPGTHRRVPTVNRAQFTSIFDDDNYTSALQYADAYQKSIYEEEAKAINEIQKGILAISQKEEPFDVFICYKETDNNGRRTPDSVLANELYHQLTQEGFKVFFARITLEDKLGSAYEPYIFAALNSAKVMVVLGTKPEFFKAVWVRNEWSRYLSLIKQGQKKMLIPAYKDMDPYDLPEEFSHLQAQDMSKLGFMQDLIRGIKKIAQEEPVKTTVIKETVVTGTNANTEPLLRRAFMFLEDGDFASADEYCEKVLDIEPENARAYLGKLLSDLKVRRQELLKDCALPFDQNNNYQKVIRFADAKLRTDLKGYIEYINTRNENERLENIYNQAQHDMFVANTENAYKGAAQSFESISGYRNAKELAIQCREKAEISRKDAILAKAKGKMNGEVIEQYEEAQRLLKTISGWKNADDLAVQCLNTIEELKAKFKRERQERERLEEERAKRNKKIAMITTPIVCAVIAFLIILNSVIIPNNKYNKAMELMKAEKYEQAMVLLRELDGYKESTKKIREIYTKWGYGELNIGDSFTFGMYEQDNDSSNGAESIEWIILQKEDKRLLVVSRYALDCVRYNTEYKDVTWETCTLRSWLNSTFMNEAFSEGEKSMISVTTVSADRNPKYDTNPGNATQDQVFLLSISEVNKYFNSDEERQCKPTEYAVDQGAYENDETGCCWCWLRSPGFNQGRAARVDYDGGVYEIGSLVNRDYIAVRPALWIDLDS